ncbi:hypothetical protein C8Q72DRAFT_780938 [Fomitopsis betulina]|nr:hypothetical protein C8Q72DRAFT_780938 [Fomitopsis betulina]
MTPFPPQAVPISFEGSSRTPIDNNPTNTSTGEAVAQGEGDISPVRDGSQGKPKRKRAKRPLNAESSTGGPPKKRRSPRGPNTQPGAEDEDSQTTLEPRRRGKSRAPSVPPFDPDAHPGEDLDPTTVTMASLCDDTGQGRVSSKATQVISNHATWRTTSKEKRARLRAIAEAKKYGRDIEDDDQSPAVNSGDAAEPSEANPSQKAPSTSRSPSAVPQAGPSTPSTERPAQGGRMGDEFDYSTDLSTSRYNVQVRIGANGETIIDEESLFVNRNEEDDTQNYTHVEESDTTKFVNSLTYGKKTQGSRWSTEETDLFFDALSQFGENYELISLILPGRDRKACKNKFKAEDKKNPARINFCLNNRKPFDIQTLARMTGKDFSGPTPVIRAPTPVQSKELDSIAGVQPEVTAAPKVTRKKNKKSAVKDGEEILGSIDDMDQEDSIFGDKDDA